MESSLPDRLRTDLKQAMKSRATLDVSVLRTTLGAIANAEAAPAALAPEPTYGRLAEHPRVHLTAQDHADILLAEIADREDTIRRYTGAGRHAEAEVLGTEIAVLRRYVPADPPA